MSKYLIKKYAECQNCKTIQSCNKSKHFICSEFDLKNTIGVKLRKSKDLCLGCYNNYYNQERDGCYSYKSATVILKSVWYSSSQRPPWNLEWKLSCWRR